MINILLSHKSLKEQDNDSGSMSKLGNESVSVMVKSTT